MRICPRCNEENGHRRDYCAACGYLLVLEPRPVRHAVSARRAGTSRRRCCYCGAVTTSLACAAHADLLADDPALALELEPLLHAGREAEAMHAAKGTGS